MRFEAALWAAMHETDEYVWVYGETPRWWGRRGSEARIPEAYSRAMRHAAWASR